MTNLHFILYINRKVNFLKTFKTIKFINRRNLLRHPVQDTRKPVRKLTILSEALRPAKSIN